MALLTATEVKAFLRETSTDYDTLIGTYIPLIEKDICEYLNNWFDDKAIYVESPSGLAFNQGATSATGTSRDYIVDDNAKFSTVGLTSGMDIIIQGGSNYGIRTISSDQSSGTLYMTGAAIFVDQDQDNSYHTVGEIRISRINWPSDLKPIAAKMIWYQIENAKPNGAVSERIDDYSITFVNGREYPMQLINQLDKRRHVRTH